MTKPPRNQFSAAEVREQTRLDNQEQVLKVQLEKIDGKLDAKLKEVQEVKAPSKPRTAKSPASNVRVTNLYATSLTKAVSKYKKKRAECSANPQNRRQDTKENIDELDEPE